MKVKELIEELQKMDPEKEISIGSRRNSWTPKEVREGRHVRTKNKVVIA